MLTKIARRRDPDAPIGQPAALHLMCPCGTRIDLTDQPGPYACACGYSFTAAGDIVTRPIDSPC